MLLHVFEVIDRLKLKQKERIERRGRLTRRASNNEDAIEAMQQTFIVAMDNYFSLPKVIAKLREMGVGMVGTSRPKSNWPPKELKVIDSEKANFNEFYWLVDDYGTLVARWKDNGMVLCCSTIHSIGNTILRLRKKPRPTLTNKSHVKEVWGDKGSTNIKIPTLIDDYNHWMGGVDKSDQLIAYYHPDIRCQRTWMPMFLQIISMVRSNCYIIYKSKFKDQPRTKVNVLSHKQFTLSIIDILLQKAEYYQRQSALLSSTGTTTSSTSYSMSRITNNTPARRSITTSINRPPPSISFLPKESSLLSFDHSSIGATSSASIVRIARQNHKRVKMVSNEKDKNGKPKRLNKVCKYCSKLYTERKKKGEIELTAKWDKMVKRTEMGCAQCGVFLCADCFNLWHDEKWSSN